MLLALGSVLLTGASAEKAANAQCDLSALRAWIDSKSAQTGTPAPPTPIGTVAGTTMAPTTTQPTAPAPAGPRFDPCNMTEAEITAAGFGCAEFLQHVKCTDTWTGDLCPGQDNPSGKEFNMTPISQFCRSECGLPPTTGPTMAPTTMRPTPAPTPAPTTMAPTTAAPTTAAPTTMAPTTATPTTAPTASPTAPFDPCNMTENEVESTSCDMWLRHFQCTDTWTNDICPGKDHPHGTEFNMTPISQLCRSECGLPPVTAPAPAPQRFAPCTMTEAEVEKAGCAEFLQHVKCTDTWTGDICPGQDSPAGPEFNLVPIGELCRSECGLPPAIEVQWEPNFGASPPLEHQKLDVEPGTELTFVWSTFHNVWQTMATASECNFDGAKEVSTGFSGPAKFTVPSNAASGDQFHFACRVGNHCSAGQHLTVTVRRGSQANQQRRRLKSGKLAAAADLLDGLTTQCKPCVQSCVGSTETRRLDFNSETLLDCLMGCVSVDCSVLATQEACEAQAEHCMWNEGTGVRRRLKAGICESKPVDKTRLLKNAKNKIANGSKTEMIIGGVVVSVVFVVAIAGLLRYCRKARGM